MPEETATANSVVTTATVTAECKKTMDSLFIRRTTKLSWTNKDESIGTSTITEDIPVDIQSLSESTFNELFGKL